MKKIALLLLIALQTTIAFSQVNFHDISYEEAIAKAQAEDKILFVDIFAVWCGPCRQLNENVFPDPVLGKYFNEHFVSIKVDGETEFGRQLMQQVGSNAFPTLIFISPDRSLLKMIRGYQSADNLLAHAKGVINPEEMPSDKAMEEFENDPTRENHRKLIETLLNDNRSVLEASSDYYAAYPDLDLENNVDFIVFYLLEDNIESEMFQSFLSNIDVFTTEVIQSKLEQTLLHYLKIAVNTEELQTALNALDILFPYYRDATSDEADKEYLIEVFNEVYEKNIDGVED